VVSRYAKSIITNKPLTRLSGISFLYAIWHSTLVRSQLTLDDVDFTVLIATSVLTDLIDKCPPAEACRDAFTRMSKATISMVMSTTGFGNASTLSSQPLNSPSEYFRPQPIIPPVTAAGDDVGRRKLPMPQFDMNLKDLFSDDELANRPPAYQPRAYGHADPIASLGLDRVPSAEVHSEHSAFSVMSPQSTSGASQYHHQAQSSAHAFQLSNQQPYNGLAETISQVQPDMTFDDLSFLDSFPVADPNNAWAYSGDLDLGFGTGGTGMDGNGQWDSNAGPDLFDGFFFGQ
jgi:hypothetical protein